jgi:hypothetical protein
MMASQAEIESLAERVERAYRLRRPNCYRSVSTPGVWTTAAALLYRIHQDDPEIPIDPELFVAVQPSHPSFSDPWGELTQPVAARRYVQLIRKIVRGLQSELRTEVLRAEVRVRRGETIDQVIRTRNKNLSPLGCFIVTLRSGRPDLAARFRTEAAAQHRSCPLYRQAILRLLAPEDYPVVAALASDWGLPKERAKRSQMPLN